MAESCSCYSDRMTRRFLIDTDTASADAVALIMALRAPYADWSHGLVHSLQVRIFLRRGIDNVLEGFPNWKTARAAKKEISAAV